MNDESMCMLWSESLQWATTAPTRTVWIVSVHSWGVSCYYLLFIHVPLESLNFQSIMSYVLSVFFHLSTAFLPPSASSSSSFTTKLRVGTFGLIKSDVHLSLKTSSFSGRQSLSLSFGEGMPQWTACGDQGSAPGLTATSFAPAVTSC